MPLDTFAGYEYQFSIVGLQIPSPQRSPLMQERSPHSVYFKKTIPTSLKSGVGIAHSTWMALMQLGHAS
ncbi:hypothetical protein ACQ4M4_22955 [Leptolyngbya sp. AN02str]|uniref:hypothetical protein n=1 Tax=Leptolyngbya sp. AN02str TaxID=3423363 RepID=UPI003D31DD56